MALHGGLSVKRVCLSEVVSYNESLLKKTAHDISKLPLMCIIDKGPA